MSTSPIQPSLATLFTIAEPAPPTYCSSHLLCAFFHIMIPFNGLVLCLFSLSVSPLGCPLPRSRVLGDFVGQLVACSVC